MTWTRLRPWAWRLGAVAAAGATVGIPAAAALAVLLWVHGWIRPVVLDAAVVAFAALPVLWLAGSTVPFADAAARVQSNTVLHQVAGLAVWLLVVGVSLQTWRSDEAGKTEDVSER